MAAVHTFITSGRGNINQNGCDVARFRFERAGVVEQLVDRVRRHVSQFRDAAITREPRRITHQTAQARVVGVLIFNHAGRENHRRSHTP
jgi:hypothetical protein